MKRIFTLCMALCTVLAGFAQTDTTGKPSDTIKVGSMIIVRKAGSGNAESKRDKHIIISNNSNSDNHSGTTTYHYRGPNISTNWIILDLGFANYNDKTNYSTAQSSGFVSNDFSDKDNLKLRTVKSVNVNIWFFMQRMNLISHVVNLKYGLGLELNNYRYDNTAVRFHKDPTSITIDETLKDANVKKDKLAADYITVPLMLNFNFTPRHRNRGFGLSAGVSAGYLYSARQKFKIDGHKSKLHDDFDLERFKLSYIGELNLGIVKLYGSYAFKSMWSKGLDQTPYNVGLRFSNW
ncbi:MAG: outer membrane beta-barrel protein [Chitinophagaceae bacterium]